MIIQVTHANNGPALIDSNIIAFAYSSLDSKCTHLVLKDSNLGVMPVLEQPSQILELIEKKERECQNKVQLSAQNR